MLKSQKHVFWQALFVTILIFGVGIVFGIILENWRTGKVDELYQRSEISLLDIKLQTEIYSQGDFKCNSAVRETFNFAERIYEEARQLERYETASTLSEELKTRHQKYDILRANLFFNSLRIREKCEDSFNTALYIYQYNNQSIDTKAKQNVFSKLLGELKDREGTKLLLVPMAGDNGIVSINLIMDKFNIAKEELPVILINNDIKINDLTTVEELEAYIKKPKTRKWSDSSDDVIEKEIEKEELKVIRL
ncbi:hypothetical protein GOV12_05200 [Candidatus Pacearchaeota archaeon]|nr:hypothetical protein [Candidatus Pacearchaeota archaeon]